MNQPINIYGVTSYYENGIINCIHHGVGYRDDNGYITWYGDYNPPEDDEFHDTIIFPYGNGHKLTKTTIIVFG